MTNVRTGAHQSAKAPVGYRSFPKNTR